MGQTTQFQNRTSRLTSRKTSGHADESRGTTLAESAPLSWQPLDDDGRDFAHPGAWASALGWPGDLPTASAFDQVHQSSSHIAIGKLLELSAAPAVIPRRHCASPSRGPPSAGDRNDPIIVFAAASAANI
jgi:hypothetical protein